MTPKQRARVANKLFLAASKLEDERNKMYMCKARDRYKCHREQALQVLTNMKPLLLTHQHQKCNMLMLELEQGRSAPKIQAIIGKCNTFARECANSV